MFKKSREIECYRQQGIEVKVMQNSDGTNKVSLRTSMPNMVVSVQKVNNSIEYSISDAHIGQMKFNIPVNIHQKIFNDSLN